MSTTIQEVLAKDEMIDELLRSGTIDGYDSLEEMYKRGYASDVLLFGYGATASGQALNGRLRTLSGIALSHGMTMSKLHAELHAELVRQLQSKLQARLDVGMLKGENSSLFNEITLAKF